MISQISISKSDVTAVSDIFFTNVSEGKVFNKTTYGLGNDWKMEDIGEGANIYRFSGSVLPKGESPLEKGYHDYFRVSQCLKGGYSTIVTYGSKIVTGYMLNFDLEKSKGLATFSFGFMVMAVSHETDSTPNPDLDTFDRSIVNDIVKCQIVDGSAPSTVLAQNFVLTRIAKSYKERYFTNGMTKNDFKITSLGAFPTNIGISLLVPNENYSVTTGWKAATPSQSFLEETIAVLDKSRKISIVYDARTITGVITGNNRRVGYIEDGVTIDLQLLLIKQTTP